MHARDKCPSFPWHLARRASHCIALHRLHGTLFVVLTAALLSASSSMPLLIHTRVIIIKIYVAEKKTETTLNRGYDDREEDRRSKKCKTHVPVNLPCDLLYPRSGCAVVLSVCRLQTQTDDQFMDTWMASALWEEFYTHTPAPGTMHHCTIYQTFMNIR